MYRRFQTATASAAGCRTVDKCKRLPHGRLLAYSEMRSASLALLGKAVVLVHMNRHNDAFAALRAALEAAKADAERLCMRSTLKHAPLRPCTRRLSKGRHRRFQVRTGAGMLRKRLALDFPKSARMGNVLLETAGVDLRAGE